MAAKRAWRRPRFRKNGTTRWNWMCQHHDRLRLGRFVDIGAFTYINARNGVVIEDNVQIGSHCSIYSLSTIDGREGEVVLRRGCRIGTHSVVMPGVTIGEGAVVGAMSFVNRDIAARMLAAGVPARVIRRLRPGEFSGGGRRW